MTPLQELEYLEYLEFPMTMDIMYMSMVLGGIQTTPSRAADGWYSTVEPFHLVWCLWKLIVPLLPLGMLWGMEVSQPADALAAAYPCLPLWGWGRGPHIDIALQLGSVRQEFIAHVFKLLALLYLKLQQLVIYWVIQLCWGMLGCRLRPCLAATATHAHMTTCHPTVVPAGLWYSQIQVLRVSSDNGHHIHIHGSGGIQTTP